MFYSYIKLMGINSNNRERKHGIWTGIIDILMDLQIIVPIHIKFLFDTTTKACPHNIFFAS